MKYCLFHSVDGCPVYDGDMVWLLIRGNSMYKKKATYLNPELYSVTPTIARKSIDSYNNRIFKYKQEMLDYYEAHKPTLYMKILNSINELL